MQELSYDLNKKSSQYNVTQKEFKLINPLLFYK
jgi:hypothetical protein